MRWLAMIFGNLLLFPGMTGAGSELVLGIMAAVRSHQIRRSLPESRPQSINA
jgi:hypothetical protein